MIRAYKIPSGCKSAADLKVVELPDPRPQPGQVLVRVRAASLNYRDQAIVTGNYPVANLDHDVTPLSDGAGEVIAVGEGVARIVAGDRVAATFFQPIRNPRATMPAPLGVPLDGMLAEQVVLDQDGVVQIPEGYSFEEAACLPCAGVTAWHALFRAGTPVMPGSTVLVLGTGGVSMFALQLAHGAGARVIATSSSDDKLAKAAALGAWRTINYTAIPDWDGEVMRLTAGAGADCVIEVGGIGTLPRSMSALARGGKITLIGVLTGHAGGINPYPLMGKGGSLHGVFVGDKGMFEDMNRALAVTGVKPVIDRVFPFEQALDAFAYQASGQAVGKVVISV